MNTPSVRTAEITWLSVREDMNIPIAIRAHPDEEECEYRRICGDEIHIGRTRKG